NVDVTPLRVAGQRARPPDPDAPPGECPDAVDSIAVELALLGMRDPERESVDATDDLVRGGLVDTAGLVDASPNTRHVARRRHPHRPLGERIHDLDPRPVQSGHLGVVARRVHPHSSTSCGSISSGVSRSAIRSPINSAWAIILPCRSRIWAPSPLRL